MSSSKFFALCLLLPAVASAANDWNTPCTSGSCSYDLHNSSSTSGHSAGGSLWIVRLHFHTFSGYNLTSYLQSGSTSAISDITPAAGWTIVDCDPQGHNQTIRAYCSGDNNDCSHLYQNDAVGTVVRLPENVSTSAVSLSGVLANSDHIVWPDSIRAHRFRIQPR